jgi:hypothetical protein
MRIPCMLEIAEIPRRRQSLDFSARLIWARHLFKFPTQYIKIIVFIKP